MDVEQVRLAAAVLAGGMCAYTASGLRHTTIQTQNKAMGWAFVGGATAVYIFFKTLIVVLGVLLFGFLVWKLAPVVTEAGFETFWRIKKGVDRGRNGSVPQAGERHRLNEIREAIRQDADKDTLLELLEWDGDQPWDEQSRRHS